MSSNLLMGDFVYIRLVEMQKNHYSKILAERVTESEDLCFERARRIKTWKILK